MKKKKKQKNTKCLRYLQSSAFILMSTDACVVVRQQCSPVRRRGSRAPIWGRDAFRGADVVCLQLLWTFESVCCRTVCLWVTFQSLFFFFCTSRSGTLVHQFQGFPAARVSSGHVCRFLSSASGAVLESFGPTPGDGIWAARWLLCPLRDLRAPTWSGNCPAGNPDGLPPVWDQDRVSKSSSSERAYLRSMGSWGRL